MGRNTSLSSVGRAPDCSCVKTNVSADIRVSPVQVWERGPTTSVQLQCWSPRTREVERFQTLPLSWERGLSSSPYGTSLLNREVGRLLLLPLSWERGPHYPTMRGCHHRQGRAARAGRQQTKAGLCWRRFGTISFGAKTGVKGLIVSNHNLFVSRCSPRDRGL